MKYRSDIDGLRAIAVVSVIAFHSGVQLLSGGFVGVDVFFVISGYLITTLIYQEIQREKFTFASFYKRRVARLLPALAITLLFVVVMGFFFYDAQSYDKVGKDIFFSALGLVNIYFAQGTDYFASAEHHQPLIHLWSLGVEEQFYLVWPLLMLGFYRFSKRWTIALTVLLFVLSLGLSEWAAQQQTKGAYFMPQYRAFELLLGAFCAFWVQQWSYPSLSSFTKQWLSWLGVVLILLPMVMLDETSYFPGLNALWPCLGTAILIVVPNNGWVSKGLSLRGIVLVGLISYPLYLYHQPLITLVNLIHIPLSPVLLFLVITVIAGGASWVTYKKVEQPIRKLAHQSATPTQRLTLWMLVATLPVFAVTGVVLGRTDGVPQRFDYLNPFAKEVIQAHSSTFERYFETGFKVEPGGKAGILIVGDSLAQQYAVPLMRVLDYQAGEVDTVTRGACVFLKGVDFRDQMAADKPCDELREQLYDSLKSYDYVVISQAWHFYQESVMNFTSSDSKYVQWRELLSDTVEHFKKRAKRIIVIGAHPMLVGTGGVQASVFISSERYQQKLPALYVENLAEARAGGQFFTELFASEPRVTVMNPIDLFCPSDCQLHNGQWSYFSDHMHYTSKALPFIETELKNKLQTTVERSR